MGLLRKLFFALLFSAALYSKDLGPSYLYCSSHLEGLSSEQSKLRNSFWKASEPPEEKQRKKPKVMASWHNGLVKKTEKLLTALGVDFEATVLDDDLSALRVLPNKKGNELNRFVATFHDWLGVEFIYAPGYMLKKNGKFSRARYSKTKNVIYLSHEFVDGVSADESLHHEILHAVFNWFRSQRLDSLFHGEFKASEEDEDLWDGDHYTERMSFEEYATYPVNLILFAKGMQSMVREGRFHGEAATTLLEEIQRKASIFDEFTSHSVERLDEVLSTVDESASDSEISYGTLLLPKMKTAGIRVARATVTVKHYAVKVLLVDEADLELLHRLKESESPALRRRLNKRVLARLTKLWTMAKKLHAQAETIVELTDKALVKIADGPLADSFFTKYVAALTAPRALTLPYVTSLDGKPSVNPSAARLPLPELAP